MTLTVRSPAGNACTLSHLWQLSLVDRTLSCRTAVKLLSRKSYSLTSSLSAVASTSNSFQFHRRHIGGDTAPQARAQLNRTYLRAKHWHGRSHHGCSNFPSAFQVRLAPEPQRPRSCPLFMSTTCVDILSTNLVDTRR